MRRPAESVTVPFKAPDLVVWPKTFCTTVAALISVTMSAAARYGVSREIINPICCGASVFTVVKLGRRRLDPPPLKHTSLIETSIPLALRQES